MNFKPVTKGEFVIVGLEHSGPYSTMDQLPKLWDDFIQRMGELSDRVNEKAELGVCFDDPHEFTYIVGAEVSSTARIPEGMTSRRIPEQKYLVFTHRGDLSQLGETYKKIYEEWLPQSGYQRDGDAPFFELYDERFLPDNSEGSELDLYIPIK
ncbi:GyrI-like domain-containing protein [Brevibacillus humidisoli]|uniref:GyrI-like domain-containing protein n=1 Tax=Brevibacillus humidisoli TaxID=2895522 RepID=UPI001E49009F|nr:GyrI-like domain-containing protein [Brevibacillus humidisoli]UFJ42482.1 GyrI-like domain-containing protein [Brevibacillus humidisoli]